MYQARTPAPPITQFTIPTLWLSLLKDAKAVDGLEGTDLADVQTLRPQEDAIYARLLPTLPPVKADCLKLVQVEDAVVAWPHLHSKPQDTTWPLCTQTYSRDMQIGTYVFHVVLTLRMGIHQKRVRHNGGRQIIRKDLIKQMQVHTFRRGTMRA